MGDERDGGSDRGDQTVGGSGDTDAGQGGSTDGPGSEGSREADGQGSRRRGWTAWGGTAFSEIQETVADLVEATVRGIGPATAGRFPRYDLVRLPDGGYRVFFDLPGVEREDLEVTTVGEELTVSGVRKRPSLPEGAEVLRSERPYGRFRRTVRLPADVDPAAVRAKLEGGVLRVLLGRRGEAEAREVPIEE